MLFDDRFADREPQAGASLLARVGRLHLPETFEDRPAVGHGHAAAVVRDPDFNPALRQPDADCHHATGRRELHGVGQEIDQHLDDPIGVGPYQGRDRGRFDSDAVRLPERRHGLHGAAHDRLDGDPRELQRDRAGLEPLEIEDVVDERDQPDRVALGDGHDLDAFVGQRAHRARGQQAERPSDRRERCPQLVAHRGEKSILQPLDFLEPLDRLLQHVAVVLRFPVQQAHFQHVGHARQHLGQVNRFADEILRAGLERAELVTRLGGDDQDRKVAVMFEGLQPVHHLESVHARHQEVEQDQIVVVLAVQLAHLTRIHRRRDARIAGAAQDALEQADIGFLIVNDQDSGVTNVSCTDHNRRPDSFAPTDRLFCEFQRRV